MYSVLLILDAGIFDMSSEPRQQALCDKASGCGDKREDTYGPASKQDENSKGLP